MDKKIKILMLCWDFPPYSNSGLAKVSFDLALSLQSEVKLTLVIPGDSKNLNLEGIEIIELDELKNSFSPETMPSFSEVSYLESTFSPYPFSGKTEPFQKIEIVNEAESAIKNDSSHKIYGSEIFEKIDYYKKSLYKKIKKYDFDIIYAHDWITFPTAMHISKKLHRPLAAHVHSLETDRVHPECRSKVYKIEEKGMKKANIIFTVSDYTKKCINRYYDIPKDKIYVAHNSLSTNTLSVKNKKVNKREKNILFLGRITRQKGPEFIIDTAALLFSRQKNVKFTVAGIGDRLRQIMRLAKEQGVCDRIDFLGQLNEKEAQNAMRNADIYFMPSVSEPFGISALEAIQNNIPIVVSKQSGITEILDFPLSANFWDIEGFANYLYALLNYKSLKEDIILLNSQNVQNLSYKKQALNIKNQLFKLLENDKL